MAYIGLFPKVSGQRIKDALATAIQTPPANYYTMIVRWGRMILKDPSGIERQIISNINLISNGSDAFNWIAVGGGTAASTTTTAAECPLYPQIISAIKFTETTAGRYDCIRWTMPSAMKFASWPIMWQQLTEAGYLTGDHKLDLYTNTASNYGGTYTRKVLSIDVSGVASIPAGAGPFGTGNVCTFDAGNEDYYELRVVRVAGTKYLSATNMRVGSPDNGVAVSQGTYEETSSYTIGGTTTAPTPGSGATFYRNTFKDLGWAEIRFEFRQSNAGSIGSGDYLFPLPTGLNLDYSRANVLGSSANGVVGQGEMISGSSTLNLQAIILNSGAYANKIFLVASSDTQPPVPVGSGGPSMNASTYIISFSVRVPILEWAGSQALNVSPYSTPQYFSGAITSDANTTVTIPGPDGSRVPTATLTAARYAEIALPYPKQKTDSVWLEIDYFSDGGWLPYTAIPAGTFGYIQQNTSGYGINMTQPSPTVIRVYFQPYATSNGATFSAAGSAWSGFTTARWRLGIGKLPQPGGVKTAMSGLPGMINYYQEDDTTLGACTFQGNLGGSASAGVPIKITRVGRVVTIDIPAFTAVVPTTNSVYLKNNTLLPTWARPSVTKTGFHQAFNNAGFISTGMGTFNVTSGGDIQIFRDLANTAYTNSAAAGWYHIQITYTV